MTCCVQAHCVFCRIARGQEPNKILYEVSQIQRESICQTLHGLYLVPRCLTEVEVPYQGTWPDLCVPLQDDQYIAFNDIRPAAKQHILVITKTHIDSILALRPSLEDVSIGGQSSFHGNREQIHAYYDHAYMGKVSKHY